MKSNNLKQNLYAKPQEKNNFSLIFTEAANKIQEKINQKGLDDFPKNISVAEEKIENLIMDNPYFSSYLTKGEREKAKKSKLNKKTRKPVVHLLNRLRKNPQKIKLTKDNLNTLQNIATSSNELDQENNDASPGKSSPFKNKILGLSSPDNSDMKQYKSGLKQKDSILHIENSDKINKGNVILTELPTTVNNTVEKLDNLKTEATYDNEGQLITTNTNEDPMKIYNRIVDTENKLIEINNQGAEQDIEKEKTEKKLARINRSIIEKQPIFLQIKDRDLRRSILENKDLLNKRKAVLITKEQLAEFMSVIQHEKEEAEKVHSKVFKAHPKNSEKTAGMLTATPLSQIYVKCVKGLKESEEMKDYLKYVITQKEKKEKLENKEEANRKKKLTDAGVINENSKDILKIALTDKNKYEVEMFREQRRKFQQQKLRVDVVPKISENLAFQNRNTLMKIFDYNFFGEKDFLFIDEYKKIKEELWKKEGGNREELKKAKKKDEMLVRSLETDLRDKNLLVKRLDENQEKYVKNGYYIIHGKQWKDKRIIEPDDLLKRKEAPDFDKIFKKMKDKAGIENFDEMDYGFSRRRSQKSLN